MINADDEVSLAYLISPTFQVENTEGRPLTGGWIEVYLHGTRTKYYCYSDWTGSLHPFKIPLDSLGSNIVLASPAHSYDIYIYNKFGTLVMSRYNIVPSTGDGAVIKDVVTIKSEDGTVSVESQDQTNWNLSIKDTVDRVEQNEIEISNVKVDIENVTNNITNLSEVVNNHTTEIGQIKEDVKGIESSLTNKKDKQPTKSFNGSATKTIKNISQNANGELTVEFADIDLPQEVPNVEITSEDKSIQVTETTDVQTNTKKFDLSVNVNDPLEYGQFRATNVTSQAQLTKINGNLELNNYAIKLKKGNSYHFTVRGSYVANNTVNTNSTIVYIEPISFNNIQVNVDNTITDAQFFEISYDVYKLSSDKNYNVAFSSMSDGKVSELWVEVHNLNGVSVNGQGGGSGTTYSAGDAIDLTNDTISVKYGKGLEITTDNKLQLKVGKGLTLDNDTLEVTIDNAVGEVVDTVEKLQSDLDKKITTTYPFAQITTMSDFAVYGVTNTSRMIGQLFAVPIASEIRKDETLLCVNALQNFSGNVSFGIFEYDFAANNGTGSTYWIADTGTVSIQSGENKFKLKNVLNNNYELKSSMLYYAVVAIAGNAPVSGLMLGSSPAYSQNVNANPKYTLIVSNMDKAIDWTTGTLQGAYFQGYNEQYDIPRLFMMLRNGEGSTPIPITEPFTDIGPFTLEHQYKVSNLFSIIPNAEGAVYRKVIPAKDVDIASFRYVDYHGSVGQQSSYPVLLDDTYTPMKTIGDGTWTLGNSDHTKIDGTHYVHEFTFSTPVHLTANTVYWFMVGGNMNKLGDEWIITYQTPTVTNDLLLVKNMFNVNQWIIPDSGEYQSGKPGMYLRLSDGTKNWVI